MEMNPLAQIDWRVIVATVVIFVGSYFALRRVYFDSVIEAMEDRRDYLDDCDEACKEARATIAAAEQDAQQTAERAQTMRTALLDKARERAQAEREARVAAAKAEADERLAEGRRQIAAERAAEVEWLRREARQCVSLACSKLVGDVDQETVAPVVDRVIDKQLA
jgi:F-type H+-transporting ATPase subunit b